MKRVCSFVVFFFLSFFLSVCVWRIVEMLCFFILKHLFSWSNKLRVVPFQMRLQLSFQGSPKFLLVSSWKLVNTLIFLPFSFIRNEFWFVVWNVWLLLLRIQKPAREVMKEWREKGPLRPVHIREAYRRLKEKDPILSSSKYTKQLFFRRWWKNDGDNHCTLFMLSNMNSTNTQSLWLSLISTDIIPFSHVDPIISVFVIDSVTEI
jgi:hypothetical protein